LISKARKKTLSTITIIAIAMIISGIEKHEALGANPAPIAHTDLVYIPGSKLKSQTLDLFLPGIASRQKVPVVVWIHGGGWQEGDKRPAPVADLIKKGIAVASINYRLSDEALYPAQIHDSKAAIRFLRANAKKYNLDPNKIGVWGMSAGGHLALLVGTTGGEPAFEGNSGNKDQSSRVQAVCDWCGVSDMFLVSKKSWEKKDSAYASLLGGKLESKRELAKTASPVLYVSKDDPPILIMHGDKDKTVTYKHSEELYKALQKAGVPSKLVTVKNGEHYFFKPKELAQVADFFQEQLKPPR